MKKVLACMMIALLLAGMVSAPALAEADRYAEAKHLLSAGEYAKAEAMFASLGIYEDATLYTMYVRGILLAEQGEFEQGIATFTMLENFLDSRLLAIYYSARQKETEKNYEDAELIYQSLIAFKDTRERLEKIPELIACRDNDHARARAQQLESTGILRNRLEAYSLYAQLGDERGDALLQELLAEAEALSMTDAQSSLLDAAKIFWYMGENEKARTVLDTICEAKSCLVPQFISKERFESVCAKLTKSTQKKLKSYYTLYGSSQFALAGYADHIPEESVYVLKGYVSDSGMEKIAGYFAEAGYTWEDYKQDLMFLLPEQDKTVK